MNLRILVLGTEQHMYVHHFEGYDGQKSLDWSTLNAFGEKHELCLEVEGIAEDSIYNDLKERFDELEEDEITLEEEYECQIEEYGMPIFNDSLKNEHMQILVHILLDESDANGIALNEIVIQELNKQGLTFVKTEDITSEDESAENKYLWQHLMADGVDVFY
jgi:hypothetical protein